MIQFTAIKIFKEGEWFDTSKNNTAKGTIVLINPMKASSVTQEFLLNGDPACTITMTNGVQFMVNVDIADVKGF